MMPIYGRTMDSVPQQRNLSEYEQSFPSHNFPSNPSNPLYQPFPHSGNYTYPYPVPFNSCCNHGNLPGFHSHIPFCPQPQPLHYCPSQPFSACYFPPPPHYSTGMPGLNNMPWSQDRHCFGRPFHECEDPALIPVRIKGYPYPVAWVPRECVKPLDAADRGDQTGVRDQKVAKEDNGNPIPGEEEEGGMKGGVSEKSGDRENRFQFPIVWMPGLDTRVEAAEDKSEKEASAPPKSIDDLPFLLKFLPVEKPGSDKGPVEKLGSDKGPGNSITIEENAAGENGGEAKKEERAVTRKNVPVKPELPPVCLRVDPLPKKKNGNVGSRSRSPSPPKQQMTIDKTLSNNEEPKESVLVMEKVGDWPQVSVNSSEPVAEREAVGKKPLSDVEAALRIQSAYRGYKIRRSQPLKKLKQISEVRGQVADIRNRIQALESSSDVRKDDKQRLVVGETIMRLLLQLDTIQGLLPSLRDVRKTLAKELVSLQEKLDSFVIEAEKPELETCASVPVDVLSVEAEGKHEKPEDTPMIEPEKPKSDFGSSGPMDELGSEAECKQEKPEETLVIEPEKPRSETYSSEPVDVLGAEAEEVKCKQETPAAIHVIGAETCSSGPVNVLSVKAEEVECKQEKPDETHVIESEEPKSETCDSEPVDVVGVEAEEVESRQEKPEEIHMIESEKPASESCDSGPVDVLGVEAEEVESRQKKPEEIHVIESGKPESETCDSGPVNVLGVEAAEVESGQEKPEDEIERESGCDDVAKRSFDAIKSRQAPDSESRFELRENAVPDGGSSDAVAVPHDFKDTKVVDNNLKSEKADEAQLKEDSQETHVMENRDVETGNGGRAELDEKANKGNSPKEDSVEFKKPDQVFEAIENEKLREMMEKLLEAGEKQLSVISELSTRVKDLEKKLYARNKPRTKTNRSRRSVVKNVK